MHRSTLPRFPLACAAIACIAVLAGCEQQSEDEPRGGGYVEESAPAPQSPVEEAAKPRARSAYGKAKEFAEKVVNEDVAEYQRKLMEEADRKP
jgi:hypothetical protein